MKLGQLISDYVALKQSMGMRFRSEAGVLKAFGRALGIVDVEQVTPSSVLAFLNGKGRVTSFWHQKFTVLAGFYRFAVARGYVVRSPLPVTVPRRPQPFLPYIFSQEELRRLIAATELLETAMSPLQATTFRTLLLTLYGAGLRIGEALRLTLADVKPMESLILVRNTKFFKTRLVPIGPRLTQILAEYATKRRKLLRARGEGSAFFATRTGHPLSYDRVRRLFPILRNRAGIHREDEARYQPRIHDLRATFAVHRLVAWYRQGADVQRLLPQLSTYLGHVHIADTQRYLTMTPELLEEAKHRFEQYAFAGANHA